jgi:hypothetical protein
MLKDCTPKAVSHRLNNIRNHGKPLANNSSPANPKTSKSRAKAPEKKKTNKDTTSESDNDGPEGLIESPFAHRAGSKRAKSTPKRSYAEPESEDESEHEREEPVTKRARIKNEPIDDEDGLVPFGLRSDDDEFEV